MSANLVNLVGKIADFEMSSFECNTFEILQFCYHKRPFVWQVPASPIPIPYYSLDLQEQALRVTYRSRLFEPLALGSFEFGHRVFMAGHSLEIEHGR